MTTCSKISYLELIQDKYCTSSDCVCAVELTYIQAVALKDASNVIEGVTYVVTNRDLIITGISSSEYSLRGSYLLDSVWYDCIYDFDNDALVEVSDLRGNDVECSFLYQSAFGENTIESFPFNLVALSGNKVENGKLTAVGMAADKQLLNNYVGLFCTLDLTNNNSDFNGNRFEGIGAGQTYIFNGSGGVFGNLLSTAVSSTYSGTADFQNNRFLDESSFIITDGAEVQGCTFTGASSLDASDNSVSNGVEVWNGSLITLTNGARVSNSKFSAVTLTSSVVLASDPSNDIDAVFATIILSDSAMMSRAFVRGGSELCQVTLSNDADFDGAVITNGAVVVCTGGNYHGAVIEGFTTDTINLNPAGQANLVISTAFNNYANTLTLTAGQIDAQEQTYTPFTGVITVDCGGAVGVLGSIANISSLVGKVTLKTLPGQTLTIGPTLVGSLAFNGQFISDGTTPVIVGNNGDSIVFEVGDVSGFTVAKITEINVNA